MTEADELEAHSKDRTRDLFSVFFLGGGRVHWEREVGSTYPKCLIET